MVMSLVYREAEEEEERGRVGRREEGGNWRKTVMVVTNSATAAKR
jgi:hypothetical protein